MAKYIDEFFGKYIAYEFEVLKWLIIENKLFPFRK